MTRGHERGSVLVGVLVLSIVLVILTMATVVWVQQESRVSVKHGKSTLAFHLAEAAVDRGRWKIQQTNTFWTLTSTGGVIGGYIFDRKYSDISGGEYAIAITSHPSDTDRRIVEGVGRDLSTKEVRRIYAEIERESLDSAILSGGEVEIDGNSEVHWGPVRAQDEIDTQAGRRYPRLYARARITPEPPYCNSTACPALTDNVQFWAFYDVPPRVTIDFAAMKSSAQANGLYFSTPQDWNNAYPGGSCTGCPVGVSTNLVVNRIWYFDLDGVGSETFRLRGQKYIYGTVIVMGKFEIEGSGQGTYAATPPSDAWEEYKVLDTAAASEWYGDAGGGPPSVTTGTFQFTDSGATPAKRDGLKEAVSFRGLVYANEEFDAKGSNIVHGMIVVEVDEVDNSGDVKVFFDKAAAANVVISNAKLVFKVWKEKPGVWPGGL